MDYNAQIEKAQAFRALHHDPKLLVLPNIWDPLGARLLAGLGYPAVATASAAIAFSRGYDDGQKIGFSAMLEAIEAIASCVDVPVSADIEAGYADDPDQVARRFIELEVLGVGHIYMYPVETFRLPEPERRAFQEVIGPALSLTGD